MVPSPLGSELPVPTVMKNNNQEIYAINGKSTIDVLPQPTSAIASAKGASTRKRRITRQSDVSFSMDVPRTHSPAQPQHLSRNVHVLNAVAQRFMGVGPSMGKNGISRNGSDRPKREAVTATQKSVLWSKIAFFAFLAVVAAVAGGLLYRLLQTTEQRFAKSQFRSISQRALKDCFDVVNRQRLTTESLATMIGHQFHNSSEWPYVVVDGFETITDALARSGSTSTMGFAPIVEPGEEQEKWEAFAYDYFDTRIASGEFPNTTGIKEFGKGIWRITPIENGSVPIHDNDAVTSFRGMLAPMIQCCADNPGDPILLFNLHSEKSRRVAMNGILECSRNQDQNDTDELLEENCWAITNLVPLIGDDASSAAAVMFEPIHPGDNPMEVSGFVMSPMLWAQMFDNVFSDDVSGIHCVLHCSYPEHGDELLQLQLDADVLQEIPQDYRSTVETSFTFTIKNGVVDSIQEGDLHQSKYDAFNQSTFLTPSEKPELPFYTLFIYPTDEYLNSFSTNNPRDATICALFVVALVTVLFFFYDYFVQREFHERTQVLDAKRRFIRYVSHEVRSPLNAVLMGLDIIQNDEKDCERKCLIQEIQNSANSAVTVLNEVLQYDKIEQKNLTLEMTVLDIWAHVSTPMLDFKLLAQKNRVQLMLAFDIPSCATADVECGILSDVNDLPVNVRNLRVIGDVPKILQVLRNLISNALKFTPEEGLILLTISYIAQQSSKNDNEKVLKRRASNLSKKFVLKDGEEIIATPNGDFVLHVMDSGVGMNESEIDRLFGEGVQFNANDLQAGKGSGLGLFISKNLAEQHVGSLTAKSEGIGKGSAFTLQLPLYQCDIDSSIVIEHQFLEEKMIESSSHQEKRRLRILVVDDIVTNRKLLYRLLERNGHECSMAENGEVAVEMVRESMLSNDEVTIRLYDCILMDYEMPVLNGPNATEKIREMGCDVLIIGITGNTLSDDVQHFESKGANKVLAKPVKLDVLENLFVEYGV